LAAPATSPVLPLYQVTCLERSVDAAEEDSATAGTQATTISTASAKERTLFFIKFLLFVFALPSRFSVFSAIILRPAHEKSKAETIHAHYICKKAICQLPNEHFMNRSLDFLPFQQKHRDLFVHFHNNFSFLCNKEASRNAGGFLNCCFSSLKRISFLPGS
jgi:hypothetical protein